MSARRVWPGRPFPLGANFDGYGVNFALFSEHASRVERCLFDLARELWEVDKLGAFCDTIDLCVVDTAARAMEGRSFEHMAAFPLQARSLAVLRAEILPASIL